MIFVRTSSLWLQIPVVIASLAAIGFMASPVAAQNYSPPNGAILDLNGLAVPHATPQLYSVTFTAPTDNSSTAITFAFRDDPWFIQFSNASLVDITTSSVNLLSNGDFSQGVNSSGVPVSWTYSNADGAVFGGSVGSSCVGSSSCWNDGAVQGYDELS